MTTASPAPRHRARPSSAADLLLRVAERERENLSRTLDALSASGTLELAAQRVTAARRRFVLGSDKSAAYAALLATDLSAGMSNVTLIEAGTARSLDVLCDVRAGDVLVAFSLRRYARRTLTFAETFKREGGMVIGITDDPGTRLAALSDVVVVVGTSSVSHADSPTAVAATVHILATLATASAKGARRRLDKRADLARTLDTYEMNTAAGSPDTLPTTLRRDKK
ncbi:MAG: SIS domain-containing protein [Streptosporangiales bacterium]|nr:SIS domain-containing protein [Streptosporangiales bacterium]